jgi:hypothetical protein
LNIRAALLHFFYPAPPITLAIAHSPQDPPEGASDASCEHERRIADRDAHRRIQAALICRPAGLRLFGTHVDNVASDIARIRIYSDEMFELGDRLKLKILKAGRASKKFFAQVVWRDPMPPRAPALFDVGLRVERIDEPTAVLLRGVLAKGPGVTPR